MTNILTKTVFLLVAIAVAFVFAVIPTFAAEHKVDAFVCPVLNETVGMHNPNTFMIADGDYSLIPSGITHVISVPEHATNGNGTGSPGGWHASPGETDYTAIWAM